MTLSHLMMGVLLLTAAVGPPLFLRWTWRRWQSQPRMVAHVLLLVPLLYFVGGSFTLLHIVLGWLFLQKPMRWTFIEWTALMGVGIYTVAFAGIFACVWVPSALVWRYFRPASFARLLRR